MNIPPLGLLSHTSHCTQAARANTEIPLQQGRSAIREPGSSVTPGRARFIYIYLQPCRHCRTAESGRVEGRSKRAHAREGCSGRQTAAGPASQAAARPTRSVQPKSRRQPAPQHSRLQAVRACVRAVRIGAQNREGGSCGGGFPAGGAGGAGRRTVASLPSVAIAPSGAAVPAAAAGSSAPLWMGVRSQRPIAAETARARRAGRGKRAHRHRCLKICLHDLGRRPTSSRSPSLHAAS